MLFNLVLFIALLWWGIRSIIDSFQRPKARAWADRTIKGEQPATEEQLNKCITWLLSTSNWLHGRTESDRLRIKRLRSLRDNIAKTP